MWVGCLLLILVTMLCLKHFQFVSPSEWLLHDVGTWSCMTPQNMHYCFFKQYNTGSGLFLFPHTMRPVHVIPILFWFGMYQGFVDQWFHWGIIKVKELHPMLHQLWALGYFWTVSTCSLFWDCGTKRHQLSIVNPFL